MMPRTLAILVVVLGMLLRMASARAAGGESCASATPISALPFQDTGTTTGHTDDKGSQTYNVDLSRRRAAAVGSYLVSRGVPSARISTSGRGESEPIAPNDTEADRQKNRRVEVAISAGDEMKAQAKAQAGTSN